MTDPDRLRREIEQTQRNLGTDVDALAEKVTPSRIVHRRVDRARGALSSAKDKIMGSDQPGAHSAMSSVSDTASSVADSATSAAHSASETIQEAPQAIRRGTEGNPLAAGLIAFGAGMLAASLLPASKPEQRLAGQVKDQLAGPVGDKLGSVAQEVKDNLAEPAQQAVESVRTTATDGASTVADEAKSAADDVRGNAQHAQHAVQDHARS